MKALSAELSVPALALLLVLSDFDLAAACSDEPELLGVAVGNILRAKAVPLKPIKAMAMKLVINRIFMENLLFIGFDKIKGAELKGRQT
jgi:hypothetical protein